ncbi:ADP-ribosylglycohydrolase [Pleurostoma richardsiae]|uniref:ADP-ribosylglycohydrolase n=1 Tax=Pleurostoma richardsiae TaxID=41990 RepID=A0AA38R328_9PEZI|nr:ADP-ribosylglycohydrolase [Pleurostoma richardsiae]
MALAPDYLERVYAGVLGKLIGVYLGRPFEGWTHERIMRELGPVKHYVHERLGMPLVVTDDDVSGTFTFLRALDEHGISPDISSEAVGKTWLNMIIEGRSILWWGGKGISTEHTAFLNLKEGIPAPASGSIATNGKTVAEQIGAQIFVDGWALVAPGNPELAAGLAQAAARVSHDGEAVHAAVLWAAMEAEAFISKDVDHLLNIGLRFIPADSLLARMIDDVRAWVRVDGKWTLTRQRVEDAYGYDKFCGNCHVMPNHAIMVMTLLYAGHDFHEAMHIINTCGWDTDCNSGNLGCLVALMHGTSAFENGPDWRGPLADRALISSADSGYAINNAARMAIDVVNLGRQLAGQAPLPPPKDGAQFHFTLPGSVQGFHLSGNGGGSGSVRLEQGHDDCNRTGLAVRLAGLKTRSEALEVMTPTFAGRDILSMGPSYPLMGSPLLYPGQKLKATVHASPENTGAVEINLRLRVYTVSDELIPVNSLPVILGPGESRTLEWVIPDDMDSQPIQQAGIALATIVGKPALEGAVWLDNLGWTGVPNMTLRRPLKWPPGYWGRGFWQRAWVQGADLFHGWMSSSFAVIQNRGEGVLYQGTREWTDYRVTVSKFVINFGQLAGVAIRVQGLNRYYALVFKDRKRVALVKAYDEKRIELASHDFEWELDHPLELELVAKGKHLTGAVGDVRMQTEDEHFRGGAVGFVVADGSLSADSIKVESAD